MEARVRPLVRRRACRRSQGSRELVRKGALPMQRCRRPPAGTTHASARIGQTDRAARVALTIQIVAMRSSRSAPAHDRCRRNQSSRRRRRRCRAQARRRSWPFGEPSISRWPQLRRSRRHPTGTPGATSLPGRSKPGRSKPSRRGSGRERQTTPGRCPAADRGAAAEPTVRSRPGPQEQRTLLHRLAWPERQTVSGPRQSPDRRPGRGELGRCRSSSNSQWPSYWRSTATDNGRGDTDTR